VSKGVITEEQLSTAILEQESNGGMLGEILVASNALDQETLDQMLRLKAEENICDLFAWDDGDFEFLDGELPDYEMVPVSANVTGLIMEGMRRIDHARAIKEVIPSIQCVPVAVANLLDDEGLDLGWKGVLEAVDDDRSIEDICLHTHSSEFFVCQVLHHKISEGKLKIVRPRLVQAEPEEPADPAVVPGAADASDASSKESLIAQANAHLENGEFEKAARHIRAAASLDPQNRELALIVKQFDARVISAIEADGVRLEGIPILETSLEDLRSSSFSPEEGFILSRINGSADIASIVKVSPLSPIDSMLVFKKLLEDRHIRLVNLLDDGD
jgi:hypothetical protein